MFTAGVLTASDKGAKGERADESGKLIALELEKLGYKVDEKIVVQDEIDEITSALEEMVDRGIDFLKRFGGLNNKNTEGIREMLNIMYSGLKRWTE